MNLYTCTFSPFSQEPVRAVPSRGQLLLPDNRRAAAARRLPRQPIHLHRATRLRRLSHIREAGELLAFIHLCQPVHQHQKQHEVLQIFSTHPLMTLYTDK